MGPNANPESCRFRTPKEMLGDFDAETAARIIGASNDIALIIDSDGVVGDIAVSESDLSTGEFSHLVGRKWVDTVTRESRHKIEDMLRDASRKMAPDRWREVNQVTAQGIIPFRFMTFDFGRDGRVLALGRDQRRIAEVQQRMLQSQQAIERDYAKLRQTELRYRLLFQISSEAVLIIDPVSKAIVEANPAAGKLIGIDSNALSKQSFLRLLQSESRDAAAFMLTQALDSARADSVRVRLVDGQGEYTMTASAFRNEASSVSLVLVRLIALGTEAVTDPGGKAKLLRVINRIPDAFVLTDANMQVVEANIAFLELAQISSAEIAFGQSLEQFIGRTGVDMNVLLANLREYGWVRNFSTTFNSSLNQREEVEISAVTVRDGLETYSGFVIRVLRRRFAERTAQNTNALPRTAEQLKELVGRVSLREIVRETTDAMERMCIDAALRMTNNNRASAAEILGLSRQSLYSKLNRHGLGPMDHEAGPDK